jgi:hypothetical protein
MKSRFVDPFSRTEFAQEIATLVRPTIHNDGSRPIDSHPRGFHSCAEPRGRAVTRRHDQKDIFDANSHSEAAKEEEKFRDHKKPIAFANRFAEEKIFAGE